MTASLLLALSLATGSCAPRPWPLFERYVERFVSPITAHGRLAPEWEGPCLGR